MYPRPIEVLLVEDSPGDVWLIRHVLLEGPVPKRIEAVANGELALDYLRRRGPYAHAARPDVVLLDMNLPRRDGLEVLKEIKSDPELRSITVIILTTSSAPSDVNAAYDMNANCYVVKPVDLERFTEAIRGIELFWMTMASLPTIGPAAGQNEQQSGETAAIELDSRDEGAVSHRRTRPPIRQSARFGPGRKEVRAR